MSTIVSFKDVSLNFGGVKALNNVSFDIKEGSLHAIIGLMVQVRLLFLIV